MTPGQQLDAPVADSGVTMHTVAAMGSAGKFKEYEFLLDSGSQVSISRPEFLSDLIPWNSGFKGVEGTPVMNHEKGG